MGKKYLDTKEGSLEQSVLGVWQTAIEEGETRVDGRTKAYKEHRAKLDAARVRRENKKNLNKEEFKVDEGDKEEYTKFFNAALKKFGVDSPADFKSDEEKKKFFDYVDKNYKGDHEEEVKKLHKELFDEGKMKDLSVDVDNVYKGMQKNFVMKSFADKFKKDVAKSMNIRKSLEKILPDYVAGKDIQKLMASHCKDLNASHCVSEDKFKPHMMWDPKTGKGYMAKTHDDHIRMSKMGYTHKDPKEEELSAKQKKIDLNKNGKVDGDDLAKLRKKKNEETVIGIEIDEAKSVIPQLQTIVKDKQHAKIKGVTVDLFTASMITQIYDKVNDANKKKMDGLALPKLVDIAHKMMKRESVVLEGYERTVMDTLQDAGLEYDAYFADGKLYVSKDKVKQVKSALEDNDDIRKLPKMVKETIELIEAKTQQAAVKEFDKMIKSGSVDTADFKKAKAAYMKGDLKKLGKIAWNIDTDPSERILANINQNDPATFMKMYPNAEVGDYLRSIAFAHRKMYESDEITEAKFTAKEIKMAIGIASDPRYKGGNYTGASKAIEKIKKGLSNHKQVAAVLKRQNEEAILEIIAESDKSDAKEMAELVKEIEPKLKTNELKKRVFDLAMEKYKNKSRANKIASHIK